jgi:hypothetical protein
MSTYADVKARCARIITRLEAIATDPNAPPADPRDLFVRLELLSHELRGAREGAIIFRDLVGKLEVLHVGRPRQSLIGIKI